MWAKRFLGEHLGHGGPAPLGQHRLANSLETGRPQPAQRSSFTRVLNGEISISSLCTCTTIVPTGQTAAQAPQPMQSGEESRKGAATERSTPRPTKEIAETPIRSSHTRTHSPQRMQFRSAVVTVG